MAPRQERSVQACNRCRLRRVRCSGSRPICQGCQAAGAQCDYELTVRHRGPGRKKQLQQALQRPQILDQVGYSEPSITQYNSPEGPLESRDSALTMFHLKYNLQRKDGQTNLKSFLLLYPRQLVSHLVDLYFVHIANHQYSYLHKATLFRQIYNGTADPFLIASLCAISVKFSEDPSIKSDPQKASGEEFAAHARSMMEASLDFPGLSTLQALLTLAMMEFGRGNHTRSWIYAGICLRLLTLLELHRERPVKRNIDPESWVEHETRCRLYWSCYIVDRISACGTARPIVLSDENSQLIPLPAPEVHYQSSIPIETSLLSTVSKHEQDLGYYALLVRLISIWGRISGEISLHLVSSTSQLAHMLPRFDSLQSELDLWEVNLDPDVRYSKTGLNQAVASGNGGIYAFMHIVFYNARNISCRFLIKTQKDHALQNQWEEQCLQAAIQISNIVTDASAFPAILNTPFSAYCIFAGSLVLLNHLNDDNGSIDYREALKSNLQTLSNVKSYWVSVAQYCNVLSSAYQGITQKSNGNNKNKPQEPLFEGDGHFLDSIQPAWTDDISLADLRWPDWLSLELDEVYKDNFEL